VLLWKLRNYIYVRSYFFLSWYVSRGGIAELFAILSLCFYRNHQTAVYRDCTHFTFPLELCESLLFCYMSFSSCSCSFLFNAGDLARVSFMDTRQVHYHWAILLPHLLYIAILRYELACHYTSMVNEYFLIWFLSTCISFLEKYLHKNFVHYLTGWV
jgi:hypothetical protein